MSERETLPYPFLGSQWSEEWGHEVTVPTHRLSSIRCAVYGAHSIASLLVADQEQASGSDSHLPLDRNLRCGLGYALNCLTSSIDNDLEQLAQWVNDRKEKGPTAANG
jgi:hypothetical protein